MIRARYSFRFFFLNIFPRALEFSVLSVFAWAGDEVNLRTCKTWRLKFPRIECQRLEIRVKRNTFVFYISSLFLLYSGVCLSVFYRKQHFTQIHFQNKLPLGNIIYPPLHGSRLCDPRTAFVRKNILSATEFVCLSRLGRKKRLILGVQWIYINT